MKKSIVNAIAIGLVFTARSKGESIGEERYWIVSTLSNSSTASSKMEYTTIFEFHRAEATNWTVKAYAGSIMFPRAVVQVEMPRPPIDLLTPIGQNSPNLDVVISRQYWRKLRFGSFDSRTGLRREVAIEGACPIVAVSFSRFEWLAHLAVKISEATKLGGFEEQPFSSFVLESQLHGDSATYHHTELSVQEEEVERKLRRARALKLLSQYELFDNPGASAPSAPSGPAKYAETLRPVHSEPPVQGSTILLEEVTSAAKEFREIDVDTYNDVKCVDMMRRFHSRDPETALVGLFELTLVRSRPDVNARLKWYTAGPTERATRMAIVALFSCFEGSEAEGKPPFMEETARFEPAERAEREEEIRIVTANRRKIANAFYKELSQNLSKSPKVGELMNRFSKAAGVGRLPSGSK